MADAPKPATCPCCGGLVEPTRLLVDLKANRASRNGVTVHLTPRLAEILSLLGEAYPEPVRHETQMYRLFGADGGPESTGTLKVHVSKLRRQLSVLGMSIGPVWGKGYVLLTEGAPRADKRRGQNQRWSPAELKRLERLVFYEGATPVEAAVRLGRSPGGTAHQLTAIAMRRMQAGEADADAA